MYMTEETQSTSDAEISKHCFKKQFHTLTVLLLGSESYNL